MTLVRMDGGVLYGFLSDYKEVAYFAVEGTIDLGEQISDDK